MYGTGNRVVLEICKPSATQPRPNSVVKDHGGKSGEVCLGKLVGGVGLAGFVFVLVVALTASTFPPEVFDVGVTAVAVPDNMVRVGFQC
jgi:hypothetical protein